MLSAMPIPRLSWLCAACLSIAACAVDAVPDPRVAEADPLSPSAPCARAIRADRVTTVHHLSALGGAITGGLIHQAQWFPSAAGQTLEVALPVDSGQELDAVTVLATNAAHAYLAVWRLDAPVADPTFLGALALQSIVGSTVTWAIDGPYQISHGPEVGSSAPAAYYLEVTADSGGEGFGPMTTTTSVISISGGGSSPPSC